MLYVFQGNVKEVGLYDIVVLFGHLCVTTTNRHKAVVISSECFQSPKSTTPLLFQWHFQIVASDVAPQTVVTTCIKMLWPLCFNKERKHIRTTSTREAVHSKEKFIIPREEEVNCAATAG